MTLTELRAWHEKEARSRTHRLQAIHKRGIVEGPYNAKVLREYQFHRDAADALANVLSTKEKSV